MWCRIVRFRMYNGMKLANDAIDVFLCTSDMSVCVCFVVIGVKCDVVRPTYNVNALLRFYRWFGLQIEQFTWTAMICNKFPARQELSNLSNICTLAQLGPRKELIGYEIDHSWRAASARAQQLRHCLWSSIRFTSALKMENLGKPAKTISTRNASTDLQLALRLSINPQLIEQFFS